MNELEIENVLNFYEQQIPILSRFQDSIINFLKESELNRGDFPIIHSIKTRIKDREHLHDKIERKFHERGVRITQDNLFLEITDLIWIRILYIHQDQFPEIHNLISNNINRKYIEEPRAMTRDPEITQIYENLNIRTELRSTFYTSVHYVITPNNNQENPICCEIQVRNLFEEIWGEIDHAINYPHPTNNLACSEQLKVLSKLVGTGTRLASSIFRTFHDQGWIV